MGEPSTTLRTRLRGLAILALAAVAPVQGRAADERPLVILFGGYGANAADMRLWAEAARRDRVYGRAFDFEGISYPEGVGSSAARAVAAATDTIAEVASRLSVRAMERRRTIVAGHSSGAALAVSVVARLPESAPVKLISLDAGLNTDDPHPDTRPIVEVECWASRSAQAVSFGFKRAQVLCDGHFLVLYAPRCLTPVCLHFYLVNRRVSPTLTFRQSRELTDGISGGYRDFAVNLDWLAQSR